MTKGVGSAVKMQHLRQEPLFVMEINHTSYNLRLFLRRISCFVFRKGPLFSLRRAQAFIAQV